MFGYLRWQPIEIWIWRRWFCMGRARGVDDCQAQAK
jgi:hypothetical protein